MISPEIFYLHIEGTQRGPYTIPQIDHLLNSGLIAEETLFWREGLDQWQPVTNLVKLRRKENSWIKPLFVIAILLVVAAMAHFFGSIALVGWRETNQHDYTERGAYWRARGVVRGSALPPGALVQFRDFEAAQVELQPPRSATVTLRGEVTLTSNEVRAGAWSVPMVFDEEAREWTGGPASDIAP
jgi:hypothetical protein